MALPEMNRKKFFDHLAGLSAGDLLEIQGAYWLAKNAHRPDAPRDSGERYFEHPRAVAMTLIKRNYRNKTAIIKALLHDVIEDTNTPPHIIVCICGREIWASLLILSKYVPVFDPVTGQIIGRYVKTPEEYYSELAKASEENRRVKLADRLHNMSTMDSWEKERRIKYATETKRWILPIANALDPWFAERLSEAIEKEF